MGASIGLAFGGFASVLLCWVTYMATVPSGNVPVRPVGGILLSVVGMSASAAALALWLVKDGSPVSIAPAVLAITFGALFLFLLTQRRTPIGGITVAVGDKLPAFESVTDAGAAFESESLLGRRVLLKFFRGSW